MAQLFVIATPRARPQAERIAAALVAQGLDAEAQNVAPDWNDADWRMVVGSWPPGAIVVFCVTDDAADDAIFVKLLWQVTPMELDPAGRFVFVTFSAAAAAHENIAPFLKRHLAVAPGQEALIGAHVAQHAQALVDYVKALEASRSRTETGVLRAPPPASRPEGIGAGNEPLSARPPGVGAGSVIREDGLGRHADILRESSVRFPRSASAPMAAPAPAAPTPASATPGEPTSVAQPAANKARRRSGANSAIPKQDRVDARAFAPRKLRRGTSELIRVALFRPKDAARVVQAATLADSRTARAGAVQALGQLERGATVSAVMDVRGAQSDAPCMSAAWSGAPLTFDFPVEASLDSGVAQALITIRILVQDAQIGTITFVRPLIAPAKTRTRAQRQGQVKLRRVERVFISYANRDLANVSLIASAYQLAGIACFFDRAGLKSGEEWSPRLLREIERADLFHLCWSKQASQSRWVEKETAHAMTRRGKSWSSRPDITIQMLDGPPWAPHPSSLDRLNFDDYARAAIVGYARSGDQASDPGP